MTESKLDTFMNYIWNFVMKKYFFADFLYWIANRSSVFYVIFCFILLVLVSLV